MLHADEPHLEKALERPIETAEATPGPNSGLPTGNVATSEPQSAEKPANTSP